MDVNFFFLKASLTSLSHIKSKSTSHKPNLPHNCQAQVQMQVSIIRTRNYLTLTLTILKLRSHLDIFYWIFLLPWVLPLDFAPGRGFGPWLDITLLIIYWFYLPLFQASTLMEPYWKSLYIYSYGQLMDLTHKENNLYQIKLGKELIESMNSN